MTGALAALLFALGTGPRPVAPADIAALRVAGTPLPDATLPTLAGKPLRLRSLIGRPSVIVVFASWCDPCRADLPSVVRAWSRHREATFVGVDELESVASARRFARQMRVPFATAVLTSAAFDRPGVSDAQRGATGIDIPAVYVVDRRGVVARAFVGGDPDVGTRIDAALRALESSSAGLPSPRRDLVPALFAEGVISTPDDESGGSFSPDGSEFYFVKTPPYTIAPRLSVICVSRFANGRWGKPEIVSFSGRSLDLPPHLSPDGTAMYFASSRALPGSSARGLRIWVTRRAGAGWSEPSPLPAPINADDSWSIDPSVSANGTLYFSSNRGDERGHFHIFRARLVNGAYEMPVALGPQINSAFNDVQPFVSADEKILLFASSGTFDVPAQKRPEELIARGNPYPREDLYVAQYRDGRWTKAVHLGHGINTFAAETYPSLTPDGRYLFFTSERSIFDVPTPHAITTAEFKQRVESTLNGHGNIYFIGVDALDLTK